MDAGGGWLGHLEGPPHCPGGKAACDTGSEFWSHSMGLFWPGNSKPPARSVYCQLQLHVLARRICPWPRQLPGDHRWCCSHGRSPAASGQVPGGLLPDAPRAICQPQRRTPRLLQSARLLLTLGQWPGLQEGIAL